VARVLVLSRNAAIAMGLSTANLDVVDSRPDATDRWLETADDVDVVVMQPDATFDAAAAIHKLRRSASKARALVIAPQTASWPDANDAERLAVSRLDLPVSLTLLLTEVNRLATLPAFEPSALADLPAPPSELDAPTAAETAAVAPVPSAPSPLDDDSFDDQASEEIRPAAEADGDEDDDADGSVDPAALDQPSALDLPSAPDDSSTPESSELDEHRSVDDSAEDAAVADTMPVHAPAEVESTPQPAPASRDGEPSAPAPSETPDPLTAPLETLVVGAPSRWLYGQWSPSDYQPPADPSPDAGAEEPAPSAPGSAPVGSISPLSGADLGSLIAELLSRRAQLISLAEISEIVLSECVARTGSDAGALLCRDGEVWRVAAGSDLRPLEHRLQLDDTHWLVHTLREEQKAVLIEDSDIARERLHGAPLASWEHLAAVPLPELDVFVILANREDAYAPDTIHTILEVADEARSMMKDAITARELARELVPLADPVD
jgi:hypothetical protein